MKDGRPNSQFPKTRELGIRVALGAQNHDLLRAALGRAVLLLAIGSIAGLALGIAANRILASIVYQATASDPLVIPLREE